MGPEVNMEDTVQIKRSEPQGRATRLGLNLREERGACEKLRMNGKEKTDCSKGGNWESDGLEM